MLTDMMISGGLSAGLGAGLSILSRLLAMKQTNDKLKFTRTKEELALVLASKDRAMERDKSAAGQWIRRYIVISLFTFITILLFVYGVLQGFMENLPPATYAYLEEIPSRWFGLIRAKTVLRTVALSGVPVFDTIVHMCWLIGTFYFGSSRIK